MSADWPEPVTHKQVSLAELPVADATLLVSVRSVFRVKMRILR